MEILVKRIAKRATYTIGRMYFDGKYVCDTLEPTWRDLSVEKKVVGKTAIPEGTYKIDMNTISSRFGSSAFYKTYANGGRLPRLVKVPQFSGILIHTGNFSGNTQGCILVGCNTEIGWLSRSKEMFKKMYPMMLSAHKRGEEIIIKIV